MEALQHPNQGPNKLLRYLIMVSIVLHIFILLHVAGIYQSQAISYIELSMQDLSKSFARTIPRPVMRPKQLEQPEDVKQVRVKRMRVPRIQPMKIDPVDNSVSKNLMAQISVPDLPSDLNAGRSNYQIGEILDTSAAFTTAKSYYEMVILKIESSKKYPESAKSMQQEGRITVRFVVTRQGGVRNVQVVQSCPHAILNQAAIEAVKGAAPFPRPPHRFFKKDIPMELNIIFETT